MYRTLRSIHLLCGLFALPMLLMYGVSAVQMAHSKWFAMKPAVQESTVAMQPGHSDGRLLALEIMEQRPGIRGEIAGIDPSPTGFTIRITVPGTVHEIRYDRVTGATRIRTSVAGTLGMLNRLHHAAGLWHKYFPLRLWAILVAIASLAIIGLGATGLWMWWFRREERKWGLILLAANLLFSIVVLSMLRAAGP